MFEGVNFNPLASPSLLYRAWILLLLMKDEENTEKRKAKAEEKRHLNEKSMHRYPGNNM